MGKDSRTSCIAAAFDLLGKHPCNKLGVCRQHWHDDVSDSLSIDGCGQIPAIGQKKLALDSKGTDPQEAARMEADLRDANMALNRYLEELEKYPAFAARSRAADRIVEDKNTVDLQEDAVALGPDVVAIYTLVMPDKYVAMLVTGGARQVYTRSIQDEDLNKKIALFRQRLQDRHPIPSRWPRNSIASSFRRADAAISTAST